MQDDVALAEQPKKKKKKKKRKGPFKVYREGGWLLYFWHGMRFGTWLKLLKRGNYDITLNCVPNIFTVSIWTPVNSLLYYLSEAIYRGRVERHTIEPPIFVIGHWRSGTTFLHDLLSCDPDYSYPTTYQCFFPNHFLLTGGSGTWFNIFLPKKRPMDNVPVGVDRPQEDEFAFANMGLGTHYVTLAWPRHGPRGHGLSRSGVADPGRTGTLGNGLPVVHPAPVLQEQEAADPEEPGPYGAHPHAGEAVSGARFIHISRNPLAVIPSTRKLWKALNSVQGLHNPAEDDPWIDKFVFDVFDTVSSRYEEDRHLIPEGQLAEIRYEDLAADPKTVLKEVYRTLDLGDFARAEPAIDAYLEGQKDYKPNVFDMPEEQRAEIVTRCAAYIRRFGYDKDVS